MPIEQNNPVMLITGASRGIGRALAEYYVQHGFRVLGVSRGDSDLQSPYYLHLKADLSLIDGPKEIIKFCKKEFGQLDVLLNNAGIALMNPLITTPLESAMKLMLTNVMAPVSLMNEAARLMIRQGSGRIVNFSSISHPLNLESQGYYAASKAALESFTRIAAKEWGPLGITVNAIGPNPIETDLIKGIKEEWIQQIISEQAIPRKGQMEDIIHVLNFFIAPQANMITGQVIYLGGVT